MIKWLLVIGVVAAVYYMFIKKSSPKRVDEATRNGASADAENVDEMVECSRCGVYVEIEEAIVSNGRYYCSKECLRG